MKIFLLLKNIQQDGHGFLIMAIQISDVLIYPEKVVVNGQVIGRNTDQYLYHKQ